MNKLLLLSGNDIPFLEARVNIHQPRLQEIAYVGEHEFFIGCGFLDFSKNLLNAQDKNNLETYNDFDILMSMMMNGSHKDLKPTVNAAKNVLMLLFPQYEVEVRNTCIVLKKDGMEMEINRTNYPVFKTILQEMFSLNVKNNIKYNPSGDLSTKIAEKLNKRHATLAKLAGGVNAKNISILSRYISILAVGLHKNFNDLLQYTVYQLYDEFQRFQLKEQWDAYLSAKMAGASGVNEVDHWMIELDDQGKNTNKKK